MKIIFNKLLIISLGFLFGISEEVAAQYGIVQCHYKIKGEVYADQCDFGISGIRVSLINTADTNSNRVIAFTDSKGKYELELSDGMLFPEKVPPMQLRIEDVDGTQNKGSFKPISVPLIIDMNSVNETKRESWDRSYDYLIQNRFMLRPEGMLPCDEKKK